MALIPGTRVGQYEVAAPVGAGGMGEVYRARDRKLARDVAIKALPSALASDPDRLSRLEQEARILARLNHPNIGTIYGLEESDDASYLVLELIDGETLDERLARTGPIPLEEALRIGSQIADALEAANAKGITHRDIKPSNIKVTSEGRVKVLDFGIARSIAPTEIQDDVSTRSAGTAPLPASGGVAGTPPYMSPEQIRGLITDQRTDVWAFGCVVFELLSGTRPFRGSTVPDVLAAILRGEPDWSALPASVPADVRKLLRKCLEKDVSRRWQYFGDVRAELARAISAEAGHGHARPRTVLLLGTLPVALTALLAFSRPAFLNGLERPVYDTILRRSTSLPPDPRVVIVDVDEPSLAKIGQWPWRRDVIGRLIERLRELGASAIALDMFFPEPDRSGGFVSPDDGTARQRTPDDVLAESLRAGKVVLGYGLTFDPGARTMDHCQLHPLNLAVPASSGTTGSVDTPFFQATGAVCSLEPLAVAAAQAGFLNAVQDSDGVLRRAPLLIELNGRVYPSLAVAAVRVSTANQDAALRVAAPNHVWLALGQRLVPLDGRSSLLLRYRGPRRTFPYLSAADVMAGQAPVTSIRGRIVFVGSTALGNREVVATPLDTSFVGVEVQATVTDNLLQQDFVYRPVKGAMFESLAVVGLGMTVTMLATTLGLSAAAFAALVALAAMWTGAVWLLSTSGMFLSPFYPTAGVILAFIFVTLGKVAIERRRAEMAIRKVESTVLNR